MSRQFGRNARTDRDEVNARDSQDNEAAPLLLNGSDETATNTRFNGQMSSRKKRLYLGLSGAAILIVLLVLVIVGLVFGLRIHKKPGEVPDYTKLPGPKPGLRNPSYLERGRHGAVAAESEICSKIGLDVLKEGGTATDSAIASALCVGVVNSFSSGIGGGGFLIIRPSASSNDTPITIDFRETSPSGSFPSMYAKLGASSSKIGGLAVGVPGELRGYEEAYERYGGGVSWARLFQPSIDLCEKGWTVPAELERRLKLFGSFMIGKKEWEDIFAPGGKLLERGQKIRRPAYGRTLRTLAEKGADAFYEGPLAESSISTIRKAGGVMTLQDMANYKANVAPAVTGTYRNRTIYTTDAPTSGPVLIHLLNILEHYDLEEEGRSPLNTHRFVEALKYAFARRTSLGDPAFAPDQEARVEKIVSKKFASEVVANLTDDRTHRMPYYEPEFAHHDDHGTTHLSVVDSEGSAVALTTTVNLIFGSRVMDPKTGIIFNDEQDDFATPGTADAFGLYPSPYNFPEHNAQGKYGKRPLSSTSPTIIDDADGNFWLALGGSGGSRIFGAVAQVLLNIDWGYDLSHAIEEPRVHDQLLPAYVSVESGLRTDLIEGLSARGHNVTLFDINLGIAEIQAVMRSETGWYYGASDSRKNGVALAY